MEHIVAHINTLSCLSGKNSVQCEGHGTHKGGARDPGDGASPLHRGPVVRLPDWRQTLPHTGVPERWVWCKQNLKLQPTNGVLPA